MGRGLSHCCSPTWVQGGPLGGTVAAEGRKERGGRGERGKGGGHSSQRVQLGRKRAETHSTSVCRVPARTLLLA